MEPAQQRVQVSAADRLEGCQGAIVQRRLMCGGLGGGGGATYKNWSKLRKGKKYTQRNMPWINGLLYLQWWFQYFHYLFKKYLNNLFKEKKTISGIPKLFFIVSKLWKYVIYFMTAEVWWMQVCPLYRFNHWHQDKESGTNLCAAKGPGWQ